MIEQSGHRTLSASESQGSVSEWVAVLKSRPDDGCAQRLYERYLLDLISLAKRCLRGMPRRAADEEDLVQMAFASFFAGVRRNRFPRIHDRNDVWQILVHLTMCRSIDLRRKHTAARRGRGEERSESALHHGLAADHGVYDIQDVSAQQPSPEMAVDFSDELALRLKQLPPGPLRRIVFWKMQGYTNREVANELRCAIRTVERKLEIIRRIWWGEDGRHGKAPE